MEPSTKRCLQTALTRASFLWILLSFWTTPLMEIIKTLEHFQTRDTSTFSCGTCLFSPGREGGTACFRCLADTRRLVLSRSMAGEAPICCFGPTMLLALWARWVGHRASSWHLGLSKRGIPRKLVCDQNVAIAIFGYFSPSLRHPLFLSLLTLSTFNCSCYLWDQWDLSFSRWSHAGGISRGKPRHPKIHKIHKIEPRTTSIFQAQKTLFQSHSMVIPEHFLGQIPIFAW